MDDKRSEPRVTHQIRFFVHVHQCEEDPELVGMSVPCEAIDFSMHGMQFRAEQALPPQSLLNITIGIGEPFSMYLLRGEIRWARSAPEGHYIGILLRDEENTDYGSWAADFNSIFGLS